MASRSKDGPTHKKVRGAGGRPLKLTKELQDKVCSFLRHGSYVETASAAVGIDKVTFYDWLKKGAQQNHGIYREFSNAVAIAVAEAEMADLMVISIAAKKGNWSAAAWRLERRHPKRWGTMKRFDEGDDDQEDRNVFQLNYSLDDGDGE